VSPLAPRPGALAPRGYRTDGSAGKTAPRLLQDLLSYDPRFEDRARRNLLTSPPPPWDPNAVPTPAVPRKNCRHVFLTKESQSQLPGDEPSLGTVYKLAAYCSRCRHHFLLQVDYTGVGERKSICRGSNPEFPLHHFIFQGDGGKGTSTFTCSAPRCPVHLTIQVTPPRLSEDDVLTLTDGAALRRRWEAAKSQASERADSTMARPVDAPDFLNTYLQDSLNPVKGKTRIPLLNRKFFKTFGTDCDGILKKVGFTSAVEQEDDGSPCHVWYLPKPDTLEDPHIIEDVRYELNSIILSFPEQERLGTRHVPLKPPSARTLMGKILGCDEYPQAKGRVQTRNTNHEEDHPYYAGLGAVGDFADELLLFSFQRQAAVDEPNAPYYFECLQDLALGRNSEGLQSQVGMLASQGYFKRSEVALAYRYFDMDPAHESFLNDDHIIGVFKSRLGDISPAAAEEARRQLRIIGHTRNSDNIMAAASDTLETYEQALSWLDMEHSHADDFVTAMFATKVNDNPANTPVARQAVDIIAKHRNSQRLRDFLEYGSMGAAAMDEGEAYAILQIADRSSQLDLDILQTQVQLQIDGDNAARIQEAYAKVKQDQESRFGKPSGFQMSPSVDYPVETWPVGCCNIGNTCYLNSVLQFLFTIKPLRELVLDCDGKLQELTPEALKQKRVGREAVSLARVETGQQCELDCRHLVD
jgi:ubiquitin carboxyl-terminal hydrolase 25/28